MAQSGQDRLKGLIRDVADFPKPGITFRDITPLIRDKQALRDMVGYFVDRYKDEHIDAVVAIESRGFILGAAVAYELNAGLVLVRKHGKLPHKTYQEQCTLEYGKEILEIHQDSLDANHRVLLMDDVLATGGTMAAAIRLVEKLNAKVIETAFLIELIPLMGRKQVDPHSVYSLIQY